MSGAEQKVRAQWTDVKDGLPQTGVPCLVVWSGKVQELAYRRTGYGFNCCDGYGWEAPSDLCIDPIPDEEVTHWTPFPIWTAQRIEVSNAK